MECSDTNKTYLLRLLLPESQEPLIKTSANIIKSRSGINTGKKQCLLNKRVSLNSRITSAFVAYITPAEDQVSQHSILKWEMAYEALLLPEELLTRDIFWERKI